MESSENKWGTADLMVTAAHRYCLGRSSAAVSECVCWLHDNWHEINEHAKLRIYNETKEALELNHVGHSCDREQWNILIDFIEMCEPEE